ncbi:FAD-binding oxidoreductase [Roseomonas sp. CECT 9278]|uniref:NAD(P)/FAD-dependent oxidoreductase n=1 Tax=Roseomonas sp. CECT 9278 TaxID=2845823 RepID=UPI001E65A82F|nr:FAD-dependent oxidoreductase [Roseomonas sp. CECT 9278]CAH0215368.1 tRNA 5-methylaminomethyl-2-thiouridine biosynthesis bifunctional protein MnmC [Roseomonas sp. CECT 9278]
MARPRKPSTTRDLRTGTPVWLADGAAAPRAQAVPDGLAVDVAIIGGGISGALIADALLQAGRGVAVFDRRGLVAGSTPASTALLQFEIDQPLTILSRKIGRERAARAWWRSAAAVDQLRARVADLDLRCGMRERDTIYLPGNVLNATALREEAEARARIGLRSRHVDRAALHALCGIERPGAIISHGAAEADPARLTRGLWRSAQARGAQLFAPVDIADIAPRRGGLRLATAQGSTFRARAVVHATGYEVSPALRPRGHSIISTWALATRPQPDAIWPGRSLIWEAADPYLYIRSTPDGRIILGGEDEEFADAERRDRLIPRKVARLQAKAARLMPWVDWTPDFTWAGCFGQSSTGLPAIGAVPDMPGCYAALGYGGNGITFSMIAAQMISRALQGLADPDADIFGFG